MDDGVLHHGEVGASLLLLCQGEEGGGEEEEGEQVQPHLWPRGNEQTITRENSVVSVNILISQFSLLGIWLGGGI